MKQQTKTYDEILTDVKKLETKDEIIAYLNEKSSKPISKTYVKETKITDDETITIFWFKHPNDLIQFLEIGDTNEYRLAEHIRYLTVLNLASDLHKIKHTPKRYGILATDYKSKILKDQKRDTLFETLLLDIDKPDFKLACTLSNYHPDSIGLQDNKYVSIWWD